MAILGGTVSEVVANILGGSPSVSLPPQIWREIIQLRLAVTNLAAVVDAINASASNIEYQTIGSLESGIYLQDMTRVKVIAGENITAGTGIHFESTPNGIRAYMTGWNIRADAFAIDAVAVDVEGTYILKGLIPYNKWVYHPFSGLTSMDAAYCSYALQSKTRAHNRVNTHFSNYDGYPVVGDISGWFAWQDAYWCDFPSLSQATDKLVGTCIGQVGGAYPINGALLIYFNPKVST